MSRQFIEDGLVEINEHYDLNYRHLFAIWTQAFFHHGLDTSQSSCSEIYERTQALLDEGTSGDGALDGYHYDSEENCLYLYQNKYPDSENKRYGIDTVREVFSALSHLLGDLEPTNELPESRQEAVSHLTEVKTNQGKVVLRTVVGGKWSDNDLEQQAAGLIPTGVPFEVEHELWDVARLRDLLTSSQSTLSNQSVDFKTYANTHDPIMSYPSSGVPGYGDAEIVLLSAFSLAEESKRQGIKLFEQNVRLFLKKTPLNKDMEKTLRDTDQCKSFWYGHNGITLLCDDFEKNGPSGSPTSINVENPQIVNGCQTSSTLAEVFGAPGNQQGYEDFPILTRIIKLDGNDALRARTAEIIALRTNSQQAIKSADLRANDKEQVHFQNLLKTFDEKWFYERKRGEWKNLPSAEKALYKSTGKTDRKIERDLYQQAWRSFIGTPASAITQKTAVWETTGSTQLYDDVFNVNRTSSTIVLVSVLYDWFTQIFKVSRTGETLCKSIHNGLGGHAELIRTSKMLMVNHSLALWGYMVYMQYNSFENYPQDKAKRIIKLADRGTRVKSNWSPDLPSWKFLKDGMKLICLTWANYINNVNSQNLILHGELKKNTAFGDLKTQLENLKEQSDYSTYTDPPP